MTPRVPDEQLGFARKLRQGMSAAETMLWRSLKNRGLQAKFRRQMAIGPYVADFACVEARLIVELDGRPHDDVDRREHDRVRDDWLTDRGWTALRIANDLGGGDVAVDRIRRALRASPHPTLADARATFSRPAGEGSEPGHRG